MIGHSLAVAHRAFARAAWDRWIAVGFAVGSMCFFIGPFPGFVQLVGPGADGVVFFAGSIFFTLAAALEVREATLRRGRRWGADPSWWSAAIQFVGTLLFNLSTFEAMQDGLSTHQENHLVWAPDVFGSIAFLISGALAYRVATGPHLLPGRAATATGGWPPSTWPVAFSSGSPRWRPLWSHRAARSSTWLPPTGPPRSAPRASSSAHSCFFHDGTPSRCVRSCSRASYACAVSEADPSAARGDELPAFRSAAHALVDGVADHLAALPSRPVWQPLPDALRKQLLDLPLPEHPAALDDLVATALRDVLPHAMGNGHPAFFGWVNPPPSPAGVMASLAAAAMNPSVVSGDHADVHLERSVVRWLAELVGFPHSPGAGLLTSGGSAATIVCLAGARSRALAAGGHDVRRDGLAGTPQLIAYVPAEAHSCVRRALELLGLGSRAMREVPLEGGRLDATALRASIAADRASGALPALLVGSAGTVNTGAIDPLEALADVATAEDLWFHVDGAYGAFGVLDPAIAARYRGMEQADSLVLDPHKWLGVPVDAGCALVQRGDDLRDAFSLIPPYLRQDADAPVGTFAEYGLEQTRPFRALKTWATIAARGRAGIAAQVARANALARELATLVEREPELELAAAPETSIVAFRARPAGCPPSRLDELNRALPEAVQARGRAFVTGTVFGGRETLRACILHPDTSSEHLAILVADVVATARTLVAAE